MKRGRKWKSDPQTFAVYRDGIANAKANAMHKTWLHAFALNLLLIAVAAKLRSLWASQVPLGYQDEAGFHFGVQKTQE